MLCLQWFNRLMAFLFTIMCASYISDKMWNGSPLRGEDTVEDCALPAVSHRLKNKHVLDDVEGEAVIREGTQKLSLQEGGPLLLQNSLPALITLKRYSAFLKWCPFKKKTKSKWAWELTIVAFCRGGGGGSSRRFSLRSGSRYRDVFFTRRWCCGRSLAADAEDSTLLWIKIKEAAAAERKENSVAFSSASISQDSQKTTEGRLKKKKKLPGVHELSFQFAVWRDHWALKMKNDPICMFCETL